MRLLLVDGHYYLYRSFFAIRGLTNSRGEPTNAIYGFTKALRRMVTDLRPDRAAVIWDRGLPERRTLLQPAYKQQRAEMPAEMKQQEGLMQEMVPYLGIASISVANTEADDLIAAYAVRFPGEVVISTNDKDILQMVNDRVRIYSTNKADLKKGETFALLGEAEVREKWGVAPKQIADVLALTGDTSDNIAGVPGIGQKTAAALINEFGSVHTLLERSGEIARERHRESIENARELILQNLEMVQLHVDLELPVPVDNLQIQPRYPELIAAIKKCEFKSLLAEIEKEAAPAPAEEQGSLF